MTTRSAVVAALEELARVRLGLPEPVLRRVRSDEVAESGRHEGGAELIVEATRVPQCRERMLLGVGLVVGLVHVRIIIYQVLLFI